MHLAARDQGSVESALVLDDDPKALEATKDQLQKRIQDRLAEVLDSLPEATPEEEFVPGKVVPQRLIDRDAPGLAGTDYWTLLRMSEEMNARDPRVRFDSLRIIGDEIWNLTDGRRSVNDVSNAISAEFNFDLEPRHILELFQGLSREGYVALGNL